MPLFIQGRHFETSVKPVELWMLGPTKPTFFWIISTATYIVHTKDMSIVLVLVLSPKIAQCMHDLESGSRPWMVTQRKNGRAHIHCVHTATFHPEIVCRVSVT